MKILALAATNHQQSINQQLVDYSLTLFRDQHTIKQVDLNDYEVPLFAPRRLKKSGRPKKVEQFGELIDWADLIIIGLAEYNGSYTPVFKNLLDWTSTRQEKLFKGKELLLLATSPGKRGAQTVLHQAASYFPFMGAVVLGRYSLPQFSQNFAEGKITDIALRNQLENLVLSAEATPYPKHRLVVKYLNRLSRFWVLLGYALFIFIVLNGWLGALWFPVSSSNIYWEVAMVAATFTLIIRPLYDIFPDSDILRALLKWRKGIGLTSSAIVVSFWLARNVSPTDLTPLLQYFSAANWSFTLPNVLERTTEITAWTLFLISNQWMVLYANRLWHALQKLAYLYFLAAALLLTLVHGKTYGLVCLILFFVVYQVWIYKRLLNPNYNSHSSARRSQAS